MIVLNKVRQILRKVMAHAPVPGYLSILSLDLRNFWLAKRMNIVCNHVPVCSLAVDLRGSGALSPLQFYPRPVTKAAALLVSFSVCFYDILSAAWRTHSETLLKTIFWLRKEEAVRSWRKTMRNHSSPLPLPWIWATIFLATAYITQPMGYITRLDPEAGDNIILRNAGICLQDQWCRVELDTRWKTDMFPQH
jgi:hypothetical protein